MATKKKTTTTVPEVSVDVSTELPETVEVTEISEETLQLQREMEAEENVETTPEPAPTKAKKPKNYLNNKDLLAEIVTSKQQGQMTEKLARMIMMLAERYTRRGNLVNYSYTEDMKCYAILMLTKTWASFNEQKSSNPFGYYTECVKNSCTQFLNWEKKQRDIKNQEMIRNGLNPSYSYQDSDRTHREEEEPSEILDSSYASYTYDPDPQEPQGEVEQTTTDEQE